MTAATTLADLLAHAPRFAGGPWPFHAVDPPTWRRTVEALAEGRISLVSLWGEEGEVNLAVMEEGAGAAVLSLPCPDGDFPSVGARHAPAIRLERKVRDLFGLVPDGAVDTRPWLAHGRWRGGAPPSRRDVTAPASSAPYAFLPVEGEGLHQIPVGPVHAGIIEPGHFRFAANGETVVRLEARLGYTHRGLEALMAG
ncbi:MAG TPA: NADH-quinone oxidoreductase subunit C, partial [Caulobacteraceae bacterium]|nr:NADH-quinone oxidoreductase subunit C [Caulobacteraceae bacterium]